MAAAKLTGKASYISISGVRIPIKKYTAKTTRKLADTTDSDNYDSGTDMMYASQLPVMASQELTVEGNFDLNTTPSSVIDLLFSSTAAVPFVLGLDAGTLLGSGNYDISDMSTTVPIEDVISYSLSAKLNGTFTPGA